MRAILIVTSVCLGAAIVACGAFRGSDDSSGGGDTTKDAAASVADDAATEDGASVAGDAGAPDGATSNGSADAAGDAPDDAGNLIACASAGACVNALFPCCCVTAVIMPHCTTMSVCTASSGMCKIK